MNLVPIERNRLARDVAARLIGLIVSDMWKVGDRIPSERALSEVLKVSRTTVREALGLLAGMGLVDTQAARGSFIREPGVDPIGYDEGLRDYLVKEGFDMSSVRLVGGKSPEGGEGNGGKKDKLPIRLPNLKKDRLGTFEFISWWERETVQKARIMVVGAGALGNEVIKNLALMGIGGLYIVDFDEIEAANLSRSVLFRESDNGKPKSMIAARRIKELNPDVHVQYFQGDVTTEIGLGVFRRMDGIVGCLDNREARLAVNRFAQWLSKPWVDGAIQELLGLVRVFGPEGGACYECTLTEQARREMSMRYSCPLLARHNILLGKVPTTPTISSIIGAMQAQEVLKLLHNMPVEYGSVTHFNGLNNDMHTTAYPVDPDCESHWHYGQITEMPQATAGGTTVRQMLDIAQRDLGPDAVLELNNEIVLSLDCTVDGTSTEVFRPLTRVSFEEGLCPTCGNLRQVNMTHVITGDEPFLERSLSEIGVPPLHILRARNTMEYRFYELTGDLGTALRFDDFAVPGRGEPLDVGRLPSSKPAKPIGKLKIKVGGDRSSEPPADQPRPHIRLRG